MTSYAEQTLLSAQCVEGTETICVCCGGRYAGTGRQCTRCRAPLALSHTTQAEGRQPKFVSVMGGPNAGKTVYLGMLMDMLSKGVLGMNGIAKGSHSVEVQNRTISALEQHRFPEKTASEADEWQWVHCEVIRKGRRKMPLDLVTADFAGEAIALELEHSGTFPSIQAVVSQSVGVLLLCDAFSVSRDPLNEDISALKLVSYIHGVQKVKSTRRNDRRSDVPLAIVFTKCDRCPEVQDAPQQFAANHMPRLTQYCERAFSRVSLFAARVVANSATRLDEYGRCSEIALHVEPHGIAEPLDWIMKSC